MRACWLGLAIASLACPGVATGWSADGHRIVAELAAQMLSTDANRAIADLLRDEPRPTLAGVATWADQARGHEHWRHSARWHYVNFGDDDCHYSAARDCVGGTCIVEAIEAQARALADPGTPRGHRVEALKFLVHLVGDVHQPLHASPRRDRGGNAFQVRTGRGGSNLHAVWDRDIVDSRGLGWREYAAALHDDMERAHAAGSGGGTPRDWAEESCRIAAAADLYPPKRGAWIDGRYLQRHRPTVERQLVNAAVRLSTLLEELLAAAN